MGTLATAQQANLERADEPKNELAIAQAEVKALINAYKPVIAKLLDGTGANEETFVAQLANSYRAVPDLWTCQPETVLGASLRCAQLGLAPNDSRNLAWILPYKGQAQFQLGYGGVMELARRAIPGLLFDGRPVYPNDEFDLDYGAERPLRHRIAAVRRMERGGDAYLWYVRARFPDGGLEIGALDKQGVEYHRMFSKQPNGLMWTKSYDAAALKSVVTDMKRWLPSSTQMVAGFASDEQVVDIRKAEPIEATYEAVIDAPAEPEPTNPEQPELVP